MKTILPNQNGTEMNTDEEIYQLGKERLTKNNRRIISLKQDINATRIYYNSTSEIFGRLLIIFSQILLIAAIFTCAINYAKYATNTKKGEQLIIQIIIRVGIFLLAAIAALTSLIFIIPMLICKTISTLWIWSIAFIIIGGFIFSIVLGFNIYFLQINILVSAEGTIFTIFSLIIFSLGIIILLAKTRRIRISLEHAIIESLNI